MENVLKEQYAGDLSQFIQKFLEPVLALLKTIKTSAEVRDLFGQLLYVYILCVVLICNILYRYIGIQVGVTVHIIRRKTKYYLFFFAQCASASQQNQKTLVALPHISAHILQKIPLVCKMFELY